MTPTLRPSGKHTGRGYQSPEATLRAACDIAGGSWEYPGHPVFEDDQGRSWWFGVDQEDGTCFDCTVHTDGTEFETDQPVIPLPIMSTAREVAAWMIESVYGLPDVSRRSPTGPVYSIFCVMCNSRFRSLKLHMSGVCPYCP